MPYRVTIPELTVLERIGEIVDRDGRHVAYEHKSVTYLQESVVEDDKISPILVEAYNAGDPHTTNVLERVEEGAKPAARGRKPKAAEPETVE